MKASLKRFVRLLPSRDQTFRQRLIAILVTWGVPIMIWKVFRSGVLRDPTDLPFVLIVEFVGTAAGVTVYAILEHVIYRAWLMRDNKHSEESSK